MERALTGERCPMCLANKEQNHKKIESIRVSALNEIGARKYMELREKIVQEYNDKIKEKLNDYEEAVKPIRDAFINELSKTLSDIWEQPKYRW